MPKYILVAVVDNSPDAPSQIAVNNEQRYDAPENALPDVRRFMADGFFPVEAITDAPVGVPALFCIPVRRVIQWHVMEVPG